MKLRVLWTILAAVLVQYVSAGAALAQITYSANGLFSAQDRSVWASGPGVSIDTGNQFLGVQWNVGKTFGGLDCFLGACAGAEIGADTTGKIGIDYALKASTGTFDARVAARVSLTVPTAVSGTPTNIGAVTVGTSFAALPSVQVSNSPIPISSLLQVTGPTVQGHLGLEANMHAFAGAQVCLGLCEGPAFAPPDINKSLPIASINEGGSGTLTVLGQTVNANQNVSALGGLVNASLHIPNLDSSSAATPGGNGGGLLTSTKRDGVAAVNANIAQIAADAVGLPIPLAGNLGPFGYNLLQANAGAALDVRQTVSLTPQAIGALHFTSQVTPIVNGVIGALTDTISFTPGDSVSFLPGQVASLSFVSTIDLKERVSNVTDLIVNGNIDVQALGLDIAGLSIGPLVNQKALGGDIATINLFNNTFTDDFGTYVGQPVSLDFTCSQRVGSGEFPSFELCSSSQLTDLGPIGMQPNGALVDAITGYSCPAHYAGQIVFCPDFPLQFSSPYFNGPNGRVILAGDDPFSFNPVGIRPSSTDADAKGLLATLGYTPVTPSFNIPQGASAQEVVPEPASAAVLLTGVAGLIAACGRRRRRMV